MPRCRYRSGVRSGGAVDGDRVVGNLAGIIAVELHEGEGAPVVPATMPGNEPRSTESPPSPSIDPK